MAKHKPTHVVEELSDPEPADILVPDPQIWKEFGVTSMTLSRWSQDPKLNFPPAIKINNRCYRSRRQIEEFKQRLLKQAMRARATEEVA